MISKLRFVQQRELLFTIGAAFLVIAAAFWFAFQFVQPAPPMKMTIATASKGSPYYRLAEQYQQYLARSHVVLELKETDGSFENLKLLRDPRSGVQLGFLQGGIANKKDVPELLSIGRVSYEPLWVFYRDSGALDQLAQLKGKRVLVGPPESGTQDLAMRLLAVSGVNPETATLITMELPDYIDALEAGKADAGFLVLAPNAATIQKLFNAPNIHLMNFAQADAYSQLFPYLSRLVLKQGVIDLTKNIPDSDQVLLATQTALVARDDLHPALVNLLTQAVINVHAQPVIDPTGKAQVFQRAGEFPITVDPEFPVAEEAQRVYKSGPPFFQRYLPFWLATLVDRMIVLLLPFIGIVIPLIRILPMAYAWNVRRRILYWYRELRKVEADLDASASPEQLSQLRSNIEQIEEAVSRTAIPQNFSDQFYTLRAHIDVVRRRLGIIGRA